MNFEFYSFFFTKKKIYVSYIDICLNQLCTRVETLEKQAAIKDAKIIELERKCDALEKANTPEAAAKFCDKLPKNISNVILNIAAKENSERIKKENNLILFGIPESAEDNSENRNENDKTRVKSVLAAIGIKDDDDKEIVKIIRLKNKAESTKPGQILLECANKEFKLNILKAAKGLKTHTQYKSIYINNDLTSAQQDGVKKLRDDRNDRNSRLPHTVPNDLKYGYHNFSGDEEKSKFYWGIRNNVLKKIKAKF